MTRIFDAVRMPHLAALLVVGALLATAGVPALADPGASPDTVLRDADGVWFNGGRQWNIVDSYANTLTYREFHKVLERGGVIGGSSAGATMVRATASARSSSEAPSNADAGRR